MSKKSLLILNIVLVLGIALALCLNLYKRNVTIDCNYDASPHSLMELVGNRFPELTLKNVSVIFVFNRLPAPSGLEAIAKLHAKFKEEVSVLSLFNEKFKYQRPLTFPFKFLSRMRISCKRDGESSDKNFYIVLKDNRIQYSDGKLELTSLALMIKKYLNPQLNYTNFAVSSDELKHRIAGRIDKGNLHLTSLKSNEEKVFKDFSGISKVYFIHATCSTCQLKSLFSQLKLKQVMDNHEKLMVIFSVFADSFKLNEIIGSADLNLDIYLDSKDNFNLFSTITNDKENPLIIDLHDSKI